MCLDPVQGFDLVFRFSVCIINLITDVVQYWHVHVYAFGVLYHDIGTVHVYHHMYMYAIDML